MGATSIGRDAKGDVAAPALSAAAAPAHSSCSSSGQGGASWLMAAYLLLNGVMAPAVLAQPYAFAVLGWGGGIAVNLVMALASWYCMYHQASLFHYKGRNSTYKKMAHAILEPSMGPWGGVLVAFLQCFINVGSTISNMILSGQLLQAVYSNVCSDPQQCTFSNTSAWIAIAGTLSYIVYLAVPDMSVLAWASICGSFCAVYYCVAGMVMAGIDGNASTASYTITGPMDQQIFNALNGIGILLFLFGITVLPEIQGVLADDPKTGSTTWPMIKAATAVHFVFVPLYMLVGVIGFWAYGTNVATFLLFGNTQPTGLVISAELLAAFQLQLVSQVMMLPVFEAAERSWMRHVHRPGRHWMVRTAAKAKTAATSAAITESDVHDVLSPRMSRLASHLSSITQRHSDRLPGRAQAAPAACVPHQHVHEHSTTLEGSGPPQADTPQQCAVRAPSTAQDACRDSLHDLPWGQQDKLACDDQHQLQEHCIMVAAAAAAAAEYMQPEQPSLLLKFLNRTLITGLMLFVACALPFFGAIMGFFGAVGFGPVTYALPTVLYLLAFGHGMPCWEWWCNLVFILFWLVASLLAAIGSGYAIVMSASTYTFFS